VHWLDPSYRDKIHASQRGQKSEARRKAALERWAKPEFREKMKKMMNDPDKKSERSDTVLRGWKTRRDKDK